MQVKKTKTIKLLKAQKAFLLSKSKKALLLAGIGYGKSFTGAHFVIKMLSEYPRSNGLITANTYTQLVNATIKTLTSELDYLNIPYHAVLGGANKHIDIYGVTIFLYSLERPDTIRGIEVGWWLSDESAFAKKEAIQICRGRLRDENGPLYERHTTSPNGFNWCYEEFENKDRENKTPKIALYRGITRDNIFLPDGYYDTLLEDYGGEDNPLAKQELFGQFTNLQEGAIYWAFDREKHVKSCSLNKDFPVYVGQDFNVSNMEGCYVQFIDGTFYVCQENILTHHGANTDNAATKICKDLAEYRPMIIPDSTGKAVKTSARGASDIEILRRYGLEVIPTHNPFIRDRQNAVNLSLKKIKMIIDPSCKFLIKEFETLSSRDKEGDKAHVSVSLGYVVWKLAPIRRATASRMIQL
jgi:phage terminase large subunit